MTSALRETTARTSLCCTELEEGKGVLSWKEEESYLVLSLSMGQPTTSLKGEKKDGLGVVSIHHFCKKNQEISTYPTGRDSLIYIQSAQKKKNKRAS